MGIAVRTNVVDICGGNAIEYIGISAEPFGCPAPETTEPVRPGRRKEISQFVERAMRIRAGTNYTGTLDRAGRLETLVPSNRIVNVETVEQVLNAAAA